MRPRLAAALLALAACSVKLEGGRCQTDQNCLDDERCDTAAGRCIRCQPEPSCPAQDVTCADATTVRMCLTNHGGCRYLASLDTCAAPLVCQDPGTAASCVCPPAGPRAGDGCSAVGQTACDAASPDVVVCQQAGSCLVWEPAPAPSCSSQGKVCGSRSAAPACECPQNPGPDFYADSSQGSVAGALPFATGAQSPPDCRFKTLKDALAKAASYALGPPARSSSARATGWSTGQMVFSQATGESFPLDVQPGVTLTTSDAPPAPGKYVVQIDAAAAVAGVRLHESAVFSGFIVQSVSATGDGIDFSCGAATPAPVVQAVTVDGNGKLLNAVNASGACGAQIISVDAGGAAGALGAALHVEQSASTPVTVTGGVFHTSPVGVRLISGIATVAGAEVTANTSYGLCVGCTIASINVDASSLNVHANGDTGLYVWAPSTSAVKVVRSRIYANNTNSSNSGFGTGRLAGGVILRGATPTFIFHSNSVYQNKGDQIGVWDSGAWEISGGTSLTACGVSSNVLTCRDKSGDPATPWYLVYSTGATVAAGANYWQNDPPALTDTFGAIQVNPVCGKDTTIACP